MPEKPTEEDAFDLPDEWTEGAKETFLGIMEERPELSSAEVSQLWQACALESAADALDTVARAAGMTAKGSTGQVVAHPAAVEARHCRTSAAAIFARLVPHDASPRSAGARNAARSRWRGAGRR